MTDIAQIAEIARGLSDAERDLLSGKYDPEFARIEDASALERKGLWSFDPKAQRPDSDYYELGFTVLGNAVAAYLKEQGK